MMKGVVISFLLFCGFSLFAQEKINWLSFEEAVVLNAKKPKKIIVDVYTDWCHWCKVMDEKTFSEQFIASYINQHFYAVKLNGEGKDTIRFANRAFVWVKHGRNGYHQLAADLLAGKLAYPSIVFLNERFQRISIVPGFHKAKEMESLLNYVVQEEYLKQSWDDFNKTFKSNLN